MMKTKGFLTLAAVAAVLGGAAYVSSSARRFKTPGVNGRPVVPAFDLADVAKVEIGGEKPLVLSAGEGGWRIETMFGYPADLTRLRENLLKLGELKVGQSAPGIEISAPTTVTLRDVRGGTLATLKLGERHMSRPRAGMEMYGGYPDGRYVEFEGGAVLIGDTLDAFDGEPMKWCDAHLLDTPYLNFTAVVDPAKEGECGFATGSVCTVTYKGNTNQVARVGGTAPDGSRYFRLEGENWIYTIPSYSVERLVGKPKEHDQPTKAEPVAATVAPAAAGTAEAKPAE